MLAAVVGSVGLLVGLGGLAAQEKPSFAGRWVLVSPAESAGQEQIVTQDGTTLTAEHAAEGHGHKSVYRLDGTESRNVLASHGSEIVTLSKASWTSDRLTIESHTTYPDGRKLHATAVWSLDAEGRLLIELTERGMRPSPTSTKLLYAKR
jgi:hypothetical protein